MSGVGSILIGSGLWGLAWWPIRGLVGLGLSPLLVAVASCGAATLMLAPGVVGSRKRWWPYRGRLGAIAASGAIWNIAFFEAMATGEAGRVILLYYLSTGWAIVGGRLFLGESISGRRGVSVVLAFAGAAFVLAPDSIGAGASFVSTQDLLAIVAGLGHVATNLLFRAAADCPTAVKNSAMFSGTVVAGLGLLVGDAPMPAIDPLPLALAAGFGLAWVLAADSLVQFGVGRLPAAQSAVLALAELPITVASAALLAGERLSPTETAGGLLIAVAVLNEIRTPSRTTTTLAQGAVP